MTCPVLVGIVFELYLLGCFGSIEVNLPRVRCLLSNLFIGVIVQDALPLQPLEVGLREGYLLATNMLVHRRLGKLRLVNFVVAVPSVAHQIYQDVFLELLAVLSCKSHDLDNVLYALSVDMYDGDAECLGYIRAVLGGAGVDRPGGIADLVVDY